LLLLLLLVLCLLVIVLAVLRFVTSDYPFSILNHFFYSIWHPQQNEPSQISDVYLAPYITT